MKIFIQENYIVPRNFYKMKKILIPLSLRTFYGFLEMEISFHLKKYIR